MKVKELISKLKELNPNAETSVIVHNKDEQYSLTWGGGCEGTTKKKSPEVNFYVDRLNQSERESKEVEKDKKSSKCWGC